MSNSTSLHKINSDKGLSLIQRITWMLVNCARNNYFPNSYDNLKVKAFQPDITKDDWCQISKLSSPSRFLSDLFWKKMDWNKVQNELGEVHVLDTGSGNGAYALKLQNYGCAFTHYRGLDMADYSDWSAITNQYPRITFKKQDSADLLPHIPEGTNLFISQSAIEHFDEDLKYFRDIKQYIETTSKPIIQIHLFPSAECLKLYLWHGVRQYTPRTVSKITSLFDGENDYSILYRLGGNACNKLHWSYVTLPVYLQKKDLRKTKTEEYFEKLKLAISKDMNSKQNKASFYALVIHSNCQSRIFETMPALGDTQSERKVH